MNILRQTEDYISTWRILIVEDDEILSDLMARALRREQYQVSIVNQGDEAVSAILEQHPHLVLLDLMLPKLDGVEVCRQVREHFSGKIIMLTARSEDTSQLQGFEVGADDYVVKPIQPKVLIARIKAHLRQINYEPMYCPPLKIDLSSRTVSVYGQTLRLTTSEFDLLAFLSAHPGQTLTRQELYYKLRGIDYDGLDRSIDLRVSKLRSNLRSMGLTQEVIKTVHGRGYHFVPLGHMSEESRAPQDVSLNHSERRHHTTSTFRES